MLHMRHCITVEITYLCCLNRKCLDCKCTYNHSNHRFWSSLTSMGSCSAWMDCWCCDSCCFLRHHIIHFKPTCRLLSIPSYWETQLYLQGSRQKQPWYIKRKEYISQNLLFHFEILLSCIFPEFRSSDVYVLCYGSICKLNRDGDWIYHHSINKYGVSMLIKSIWLWWFWSSCNCFVYFSAIQKSDCFHSRGHDVPCSVSHNPYMIGLGILEIFLSQIPNFHKLSFLSVIAAIMSFAYSSIGIGLAFEKVVSGDGSLILSVFSGWLFSMILKIWFWWVY